MSVLAVKACARCGQDHPRMAFTQFTKPPPQYQFFAMCPVMNEPILLRMRGVDEAVPDGDGYVLVRKELVST